MSEEAPLSISDPIWYSETPDSPQRLEAPGLEFNARPARGPGGPTVALFARYRVRSPHLDYYGGQLPRPIWVVALSTRTGAVFIEDCMTPDRPPVRIKASDAEAEAKGAGRESQSGTFNLDLGTLLMLPREADTYQVFLWLDELVSPMRTVAMPESTARRPSGLPPPRRPSAIVKFGGGGGAPEAKPGAIALAASADRRVLGAWAAPKPPAPASSHLVLIALSHRDHEAAWTSVPLHDLPADVDAGAFRVDPAEFVHTSATPQKVFVVALSQGLRSNVLVLPPISSK